MISASVRMNLITATAPVGTPQLSFFPFVAKVIREKGVSSLYDGLSAGILRQVFYATSRFGLFEVFRDQVAKYRPTDFWSRLFTGCMAGGIAALISCLAEVSLVRISNDANLPVDKRRNYKSVYDAFSRILSEEGPSAFFRGSSPFVSRALLVGAVQVGTYDQFRASFRQLGITSQYTNVMYASMASGLLYSVVTNPFETAKNRMAFQRPPADGGPLLYRTTFQTIGAVAKADGALALWAGFLPYFLRCGGHTIVMFLSMEWMRKQFQAVCK